MSEDNIYEASIFENGSVKIFDDYIGSGKQYLLLTTRLNIKYKSSIYSINFVLSNKIQKNKTIVKTNITMTEFKKLYNAYHSYDKFCDCEKVLNYHERLTELSRRAVPKLSAPVLDFIELFYSHFSNYIEQNGTEYGIIFFDNPISINAQSSDNRTGYGNEYFFDQLIYKGTEYGETSEFPIVGYKIIRHTKLW